MEIMYVRIYDVSSLCIFLCMSNVTDQIFASTELYLVIITKAQAQNPPKVRLWNCLNLILVLVTRETVYSFLAW